MLVYYVLTFCRFVIGLIFASSFIGKVRGVSQFAQAITQFKLLPKQFSSIAAFAFMGGEVVVVLLLLAGGKWLQPGFILATGLLLIFSLALASVLIRHISTSCNCFGTTTKPVSPADLWRNTGLIICALSGNGLQMALPDPQVSLSLLEGGLTGLVAAIFVLIWLQLDELVQLFRTEP